MFSNKKHQFNFKKHNLILLWGNLVGLPEGSLFFVWKYQTLWWNCDSIWQSFITDNTWKKLITIQLNLLFRYLLLYFLPHCYFLASSVKPLYTQILFFNHIQIYPFYSCDSSVYIYILSWSVSIILFSPLLCFKTQFFSHQYFFFMNFGM